MKLRLLFIAGTGCASPPLAPDGPPTSIPVNPAASSHVQVPALNQTLVSVKAVLLTSGWSLVLMSGHWGAWLAQEHQSETRIRRALNGGTVMKVHCGETTMLNQLIQTPLDGGLLVAGMPGTYHCALEVSAYSPEAANGMRLRALGDYELSAVRFPAAYS